MDGYKRVEGLVVSIAVLPEQHSAEDEVRLAAMRVLEAEVRSCMRCDLCRERTNAAPGEGNLNSVVMFVGEGPGFEEDKQGRPFVGRSGQFLTATLQKVGIDRRNVYITNVVKCRPPNNRDPLPPELEACAGYLERQIALVNPRIIVTLGRISMRRWFPDGSITQIHGKVRNIGRGRVAVAMFHPAAALRNPDWQVQFEQDMRILPPLIERAQRANAAAKRGEALPAGAPHPGDTDYVATDSVATEPGPEQPASTSSTLAAEQVAPPGDNAANHAANSAAENDGAVQPGLF